MCTQYSAVIKSVQQKYVPLPPVVAAVIVLHNTLGPIAFLVLTLMVCTVSGVSPSRVYTVPVMVATGVPLCSMS